MIRLINDSDLQEIKRIHEQFYKEEFPFPDLSKFINTFVVTIDDEIVTAGGLKPCVEAILLTDLDKSVSKRVRALEMMNGINQFIAINSGYNQIHAFVQNPVWKAVLKQYNFKDAKGEALVLNL